MFWWSFFGEVRVSGVRGGVVTMTPVGNLIDTLVYVVCVRSALVTRLFVCDFEAIVFHDG